MKQNWRRPTSLYSTTEEIKTNCGKLFLTLGYTDEKHKHLVEVRAVLGKAGTCGNVKLDTIARAFSICIQSPYSRKKLIRKFTKQFIYNDKKDAMSCGSPFECDGKTYQTCIEIIASRIIKALQ